MISPQKAHLLKTFAEKKGLTMDLLVDPGNQTAMQYGLVYTVPDDLQKVYLQFGLDIAKNNDDGSWNLPIPARYIIGQDLKILNAEANPDYTVRPDPSHTINALERINETR
jgi:peroxiredoxin